MPRKIRDLILDLQDAGFVNRGEGGRRNFEHPVGTRVTVSGDPDCDATPYQEWEILNVRCGSRIGCFSMMKKDSDRYVKIVEWSEEDECYVGQCPGIIGPCCHGEDEVAVYAELCRIVDEWVDIMRNRGGPLPPPTAGQGAAEKILAGVKGVEEEPRPPT
jgi:predicted RNase H-like HicB family nuclease/predicted RNA binding protein YcfA (HicA-like mRNA interferase family)